MRSYRAGRILNAISLQLVVLGAHIMLVQPRALGGPLEDQARSLRLDPATVESFLIDVSTESQVAIVFMKNSVVKVFAYASKRLVSETSATGEIRDVVTGEILKPTREASVYDVYVSGKLIRTTRFGDDGIEAISRTGSEASTSRRYLKRDRTLHGYREYVALWYRPTIPK